jgi:hypothetical protein
LPKYRLIVTSRTWASGFSLAIVPGAGSLRADAGRHRTQRGVDIVQGRLNLNGQRLLPAGVVAILADGFLPRPSFNIAHAAGQAERTGRMGSS